MQTTLHAVRRWFIMCLAMMVLVAGFAPAAPVAAANDNNPITLTGFRNDTTPVTPVVYGSPTITLTGTYGASVSGADLRLKLTTNNGQTVEDLASTSPSISGPTFTFYDVSLRPGLNKITFYERVGSVTKEYYHFYVQYNDTPLVTDLKVNDIELNDPNITNTPTYIAVSSENRLNLNMAGQAMNADTVEVTNLRTGEVIKTSVGRNGSFALNLPTLLGENILHIRVFNQNKEVGIFERKLVVTTTSSGTSDQFFQVKLAGTDLVPNTQTMIKGAIPSGNQQLTGRALLQYADIPNQQVFDKFRMRVTGDGYDQEFDLTQNNAVLSNPSQVGFAQVGNPQNGFTEYYISANIPTGLQDGNVYKVTLSYQYLVKTTLDDPALPPSTENGFIRINNYEYEFRYVDSSKPIIEKVTNTTSGQTLSPTGSNVIVTSPVVLELETTNIPNATGFTVTYKGATLTNNQEYRLEANGANKYLLTLLDTPPGSGRLEIQYNGGAAGSTTAEYILDIRVTPFVQLTYEKSNNVYSFEDGYQIKGEGDIVALDGKVYNYVLRTNNISATLNGSDITISNINAANGTFRINRDQFLTDPPILKKGNNVLKITLRDSTNSNNNTTFTYNISYDTTKAPSVENVKLEVLSNGKTEELTKKANEDAYSTGANFLRTISFTVKDATRVYIEKNGKRISDYEYDGSEWDHMTNHIDYVNARNEALSGQNSRGNLEPFFDDNNIEPSARTAFEGKMTANEYGDLVEAVQSVVSNAADQEQKLALFPLTLRKGGTTTYTIVAEDENGTVLRYDIRINQSYSSWEVLSPVKAKESDDYIIVNSNSAVIKIFAENADKVLFGKNEARVTNTTNPDFYYDDDRGKTLPETYYVFTSTVSLKKGLNTIKFSVQVGDQTYNDEIKIYNANSSVGGAEFRDVLGKKVSFTVFDKQLTLKFPAGTVLLSPDDGRIGQEVKNPTGDIFVDVPLYFGIADRTTGRVSIDDDRLESRLELDSSFNYASPLFYIDAGDVDAPGGRDPYLDEGDARDFRSRYEDNLVPSRRGTLTLQYDPSIVNAANTMLTVFYHNGNEWRNVGGVVNTGSKTIQVPFHGFGFYMVMKTRETYDDVITHPFARDAMETLFAKGVMPPYSGSSFGANRDMTRGEFATMLVKAMELPINAGPYRDSNERDPLEPTFTDVRPSRDTWDYEYKYIETAARAGIIRGKQPGYFRPDDPLTREEAAIMMARALNMKVGTLEASESALAKSFTDAKDVSYYAAPSVLAVTKANLMFGEPNDPNEKKPTYSFKPRNNLTRAEMAVITVRIMVQLKKLPKQ